MTSHAVANGAYLLVICISILPNLSYSLPSMGHCRCVGLGGGGVDSIDRGWWGDDNCGGVSRCNWVGSQVRIELGSDGQRLCGYIRPINACVCIGGVCWCHVNVDCHLSIVHIGR